MFARFNISGEEHLHATVNEEEEGSKRDHISTLNATGAQKKEAKGENKEGAVYKWGVRAKKRNKYLIKPNQRPTATPASAPVYKRGRIKTFVRVFEEITRTWKPSLKPPCRAPSRASVTASRYPS